jgi:two-component system response regulator PrrA
MMPRVLVIDDEPVIRRTLERVLRPAGFDVVTAGDPDSAYAILADGPVDAVLLDLNMPRLSGVELFIAIVRRWPELQDRVVLISGDLDFGRERWPAEVRACPTLAKPFALDELYATLERVLAAQRPRLRKNGS